MFKKVLQLSFVLVLGLLLTGLLLTSLAPEKALAQSNTPENPEAEDKHVEGEAEPTYTAQNNPVPVNLSGGQSPLLYDCNFPANPIMNCGFETGDFTGWITDDLTSPFFPLQVGGAGISSTWPSFFLSNPTEGTQAALHGFDGNGPGTIRVGQDVNLGNAPFLLFDYRAAWDLFISPSSQDRLFMVTIEPFGGGSPLQQYVVLTATTSISVPDTGDLSAVIDLRAFASQSVRISFDWWVPEVSTGPAFFQLDNIAVKNDMGFLTGVVYATDSMAPIENALVMAESLDFYNQDSSDAQGGYLMAVVSDTYDLSAQAFGYQETLISGISLVSSTTTTQDIPMTPAATHLVEGYVTDAATGWPLYASIDTQSPAGVFWSDPATGYYSLTLPDNYTFTFEVSAWVDGYLPLTRTVGPLVGAATEDFALLASVMTCSAPGYTPEPLYFYDGFESGDLSAGWLVTTTNTGRVSISTTYPYAGNYSALLDSSVDNSYSHAGIILPVDLATAPQVHLSFWWRAFDDEDDLEDGVFLSVDGGGTWCQVYSFNGGPNSYIQANLDLTAAAGDCGLSLSADTQILFQFYDNYRIPTDGYSIDEVYLYGNCIPPVDGGLVVGNVYNVNSLDPLVGAQVFNDSGEMGVAQATPADPGLDEAFYTLFSPSGSHIFSATYMAPYGPAAETVAVIDGDTVSQDLLLPAPDIALDPEILEVWVLTGTAVLTHPTGLELINVGGVDLDFEISDVIPETVSDSCLVAITADDGSGPNEIAQLHATLDELGFAWVDVSTAQDARDAGAKVLIDRYAANNLPYSDLDTWLNDGYGYIELGDWPAWFPDDWEGQPAGTPLTISVADISHPLAKGLPISWIGLGFWAYDWSEDAVGWVTDVGYPNIIQAQYATLHERVVSYDEVGPGRAVYVGINTYGTLAGDPDKRVLGNAIKWSGDCYVDVPWIWENPITGTVPAESSANSEIMFTALYTDMVTPMPFGDYTATLVIDNNDPISRIQNVPVTMHIVEAFSDPVASFTSNSPVTIGNPMVFTNTSTEGLPPTEYYLWDFGDGQTLQVNTADPVSHNYAQPGVYTVTLTAHQTQTGVEDVYSDTVVVHGYIYLPLVMNE